MTRRRPKYGISKPGAQKDPSIELLTGLAKCFNVNVTDLIGENPGVKDDQTEMVAVYPDLKNPSEDARIPNET